MKVYIDFNDDDNLELATEFTATQTKVIKESLEDDVFNNDIKRRLHWVLDEKLKGSRIRLIAQWLDVMKMRYESLPSSDDALAELIFSQPDYKV